jgi:hypothetical protein
MTRVKQRSITLYLDGKKTSYEPPNSLVVNLLGTEHGVAQRQINMAIDFLWELNGGGLPQPPDGKSKISELCEIYQTRPASIITFALTFRAGYLSAGSHISSEDFRKA